MQSGDLRYLYLKKEEIEERREEKSSDLGKQLPDPCCLPSGGCIQGRTFYSSRLQSWVHFHQKESGTERQVWTGVRRPGREGLEGITKGSSCANSPVEAVMPQHSLSSYHLPGTLLGIGDTSVMKSEKHSGLQELTCTLELSTSFPL